MMMMMMMVKVVVVVIIPPQHNSKAYQNSDIVVEALVWPHMLPILMVVH